MNNSGMFGEMLEAGQSTVKNVVKSTAQGAQGFSQTAAGQITGSQSDQGANEAAKAAKQNQQKMSDDNAKQFLKDLYGKKDKKNGDDAKIDNAQNAPQGSQAIVDQSLGLASSGSQKSPEELVQIETLRRQLHSDYYQTLINPAKQKEESVTEKNEREEQEEKFEEFKKKQEKPDPLATVKRGTGETMVGVSG